jgi:hypothetical protein
MGRRTSAPPPHPTTEWIWCHFSSFPTTEKIRRPFLTAELEQPNHQVDLAPTTEWLWRI